MVLTPFGTVVSIHDILSRRLQLVYGLIAFKRSHENFTEQDFQTFAKELARTQLGVRSLQFAPGGIVSHVYPLEGNEAAMGHNLFEDKKRLPAVQRAIDQRKFTIAGPLELIS